MKRIEDSIVDPLSRRETTPPPPLTSPVQGRGSRTGPTSLRRAKGLILAAAGVSFLLSIGLWFSGLRDEGLFVGIWVPSILSLGSLLLQEARSND